MKNSHSFRSTEVTPSQKFKLMFSSVWPSRYIAYRLFLKDLRSKLARTKLGLVWDFLDPLSMACIFIALYYLGIIRSGQTTISYPSFVTIGLFLYEAYTESCIFSINTISRHKTLITQQPLKPEALLLGNLYRFLFYGAIRCSIILIVLVVLGEFNFVGFLIFIALYPTIIIMGMSLGMLLAPFDVLNNDVGRGVRILFNVMRFATPVMWVFPHDKFAWLYKINPVASLIDSLRTLAIYGTTPYWQEAALWLLCNILLFFVGWYVFHVAVVLLAEQA